MWWLIQSLIIVAAASHQEKKERKDRHQWSQSEKGYPQIVPHHADTSLSANGLEKR
jgi:hypothetical protein